MNPLDWLLNPNKNRKTKKTRKQRKGKFRDEEEEIVKFEDEPTEKPEPKPEKLQEPTVEDRIQLPKGKAFINVDKRSWLHIAVGLTLVTVNLILFAIGTVGWASRWEEKVLITAYALPSIYVTVKFTWIMIQGEHVHDTTQ